MGKLKPFLPKKGKNRGCPLPPLSISVGMEYLARAIVQGKEIKVVQIEIEEDNNLQII
jgi:hypothetical protein